MQTKGGLSDVPGGLERMIRITRDLCIPMGGTATRAARGVNVALGPKEVTQTVVNSPY